MFALSQTIESMDRHLPGELVSSSARSRLLTAAAGIPAGWTNRIYFECRLGEDASRVDLIFAIERPVATRLAGDPRVDVRGQGIGWAALRELCRQWSTPGSLLDRGVRRLWLELDLADGSPDPAAPPGVFVNFSAGQDGEGSPDQRHACAAESLRLLIGDAAGRFRQPLARCFASLPPTAALSYVGFFPARPAKALRVCVQGLGAEATVEYLRALGARPAELAGVRDDLVELVRSAGMQPALLHVDVREDGGLAFGLECALDRGCQSRGPLGDAPLLDELVRRGLCAPRKRQALAGWPGGSVESLRHELWPSVVSRRVNHLKLVFAGGRAVEAKAYLYCRHFYDRRVLPRHRARSDRALDSGQPPA